jgi:molecular chaperone GrpE
MSDSKRSLDDQRERAKRKASAAADTTEPKTPGAQHAPGDARVQRPDSESCGAPATAPNEHADGAVLDGDGAALASELDELVSISAQRDKYLALAQRTQADFENYRKRVAREAAAAQERGVAKLAKELLPAIDNLDRALAAAAEDDPLLEGVRLVRAELGAALARVGVESFSPLGESFDPVLHEAMATTPQDANGAASGTVVEVYQPGYRLGASIIRPARVVVAA